MIILETERFILREFRSEDAERMYALNLDPEVVQYTGDGPFESITAARLFLENYPDYKKNGYGRWLVTRKSDNETLGWCGLKLLPDTGETDVGYRFFKEFWGLGIATETAKACLEYGFKVLKLPRIIAQAMKANPGSIAVMKKIGMTFLKEEACGEKPGVCYVIERDTYLSNLNKETTLINTEQNKLKVI